MIETILIASSICIDSFALAVTYGIKKIRIPILILFAIDLFSIIILGMSVFFGHIVRQFITNFTATLLSSIILIILGSLLILEGYIKHLATTKNREDSEKSLVKFQIPKLGIIVDIALDVTKADLDVSGDICLKESLYIGIILSIDSLGVGFGYAIGGANIIYFLIFVFLINFISLLGGSLLGERIKQYKSQLKTSFLAGIILITLSILKWV
ncbi:manganese efflux pump [Clostridium sp. D2Q-14]|uniref:manganese efflux pump n=1 Tax=Anaeromonas gelatinilytica TaxID=2683194 RepID=UPI00193AE8F8|nr:manganese efflux pump [Anaeromonas gelatinilytica]MBS4536547.1 manganese efflux pump [Anaeromonas gelatinilytica]